MNELFSWMNRLSELREKEIFKKYGGFVNQVLKKCIFAAALISQFSQRND